MKVVLVTGGVRSGKSRFAEERARGLPGSVTYLATATPTDAEMRRRIEAHRSRRDPTWETIEVERDIGDAVGKASGDIVLLDCLTVLLGNVIVATEPNEAAVLEACDRTVTELVEASSLRDGTLIMVTNEVGSGVVPPTPMGRWFRDAQGIANQRIAERADQVVWMVSGIPVQIKPSIGSVGA